MGKGQSVGVPYIFPFSAWCFSLFKKTNFNFLITFIFLSVNTFNLEWSKFLSFCRQFTWKFYFGNQPFPMQQILDSSKQKEFQNTIPNLMKMAESSSDGQKTLWERRNCLLWVISPFPTVFSRLALPTRKNQRLFVRVKQIEGLTHYNTILHFDALGYMAGEKIVRMGGIACDKQFLLFSQCFLPYMVLIFHSKCTLKCYLQFVSIWTSLKFCCLVTS